MNCHHARQLISPYLDQQLTGREMLTLQDHFRICTSCEREMQSIRQVKALLRGLREPGPPQGFSNSVARRLKQTETQPWHFLCRASLDRQKTPLRLPRPQRGRRLASALVLSCVSLVSFALPFAPEAQNAARSSSSLFTSRLDSPGFAAPSAADVLSGQVPGRVTLIPVSDAAPFNDPAHFSSVNPPAAGAMTLAGFEAPPLGSGAGMTPRVMPFGGVQFTAFKPR